MIVKCNECKLDVSSSAKTCPNCGALPSYFVEKPKHRIITQTERKKKEFRNDMKNIFSCLGCSVVFVIIGIILKFVFDFFGWNI